MKTLKQILNEYKLNIFDEENMRINPNYGTDKGHPKSYIDKFYEDFFKKFRDNNNTIVEIGVRSGASLKLWREYFSEDSKIYGLDNLYDKNEHSVPINNEWISGKNVEYIVGDAYTEEIANKFENITILIDDGPHSPDSHVRLLELYSDKIEKGGVIIIEDVGYDPNGLLNILKKIPNAEFSYFDFGTYYDNKIILFQF
mgnify:CR=1 FL=1|jgi:hypothetical protein